MSADPVDGWQAVSAGFQYACGIDGDARLWCWGTDTNEKLGNGALTGVKHAPSLVDAPGVEFVAVTTGDAHGCAIDDGGGGWCWGSDIRGQLGEGTTVSTTRPSPVPVAGGHSWSTLTAGAAHTCGITTAGVAHCWGYDVDGQLGNGVPLADQPVPVALSGTDWTDLSAGGNHTCGIRSDTALFCWGQGDDGRLGTGTTDDQPSPVEIDPPTGHDWVAVSAGHDHTCALTDGGTLQCWGSDDRGQLGNGAGLTGDQVKPVTVAGTWKQVDAGRSLTCGIDSDGVAWCWGIDANGELGNGAALSGDQPAPTAVDLGDAKYATISAGGTVSCGLTADPDILCAGTRTNGGVGDGGTSGFATSPVSVAEAALDQQITFEPLPDVVFGAPPIALTATSTSGLPVSFAGGGSCSVNGTTVTIFDLGTCSVTASQAGDGAYRPAPTVVRSFTVTPAFADGVWADVDGGTEHTCAVTTAGTAWCWGRDDNGRLGNGAALTGNQSAPSRVADPAGGPVVWDTVSAGDQHSCGVTTDGRAYCWGAGANGRLGNNGVADAPSPVQVPTMGFSDWTVIAAGGSHTCGVNEEGGAFCWGADLFGQLGNGATSGNQPSPSAVPHPGGDIGWVDISVGDRHTCAVDTGADTWCWGVANLGQVGLGPGVTTAQTSPQAVLYPGSVTDTQVVDVELGWNRSCHRQIILAGTNPTTEPSVWCWGHDGTFVQGPTSTSGTAALDVGIGLDHRCNLGNDHVLRCSGSNVAGQSGFGPTVPSGSGEIVGRNGVAWRAVTAGGLHTCGIATDGDLFCWGYDLHGQVGNGDGDVPTPSTDPNVRWLPAEVHLPAEASGFGELRVTTSPAVPSQIVVDGEPRDVWGLTWMDIEVGDHEVCFTDVVGFATPPCEVVTVPEGGTGTVTGTFVPLVSLQVSTSPALPGTISVNGVPRDDWGVFTWVPAGEALEVCFGPVAAFNPPPCQNVSAGAVQAGVPVSLTGTYTPNGGAPGPVGKGFLRVTTSPALPATITVNGEARDDWGLDWLQVDPGTYQVCFSDILGFAKPACEEVEVTGAGQTATVEGTFTPLGWINATTSPPAEKTITIDGVAVNDWGAWPPVAPGPHQVCFTAYATTPYCKVVQVTAGATTAVDDT